MKFNEAIKLMEKGKKLSRTALRNSFKYLMLEGSIFVDEDGEEYSLNHYDIEGIDWEIYKSIGEDE